MGTRKADDCGHSGADRLEGSHVLQDVEGVAADEGQKMSYQKVNLLIAR